MTCISLLFTQVYVHGYYFFTTALRAPYYLLQFQLAFHHRQLSICLLAVFFSSTVFFIVSNSVNFSNLLVGLKTVILFFAVLDGELVVPCKLQPTIVALNASRGLLYSWLRIIRDVDNKALCNVAL